MFFDQLQISRRALLNKCTTAAPRLKLGRGILVIKASSFICGAIHKLSLFIPPVHKNKIIVHHTGIYSFQV
jgi:hypothetical protein